MFHFSRTACPQVFKNVSLLSERRCIVQHSSDQSNSRCADCIQICKESRQTGTKGGEEQAETQGQWGRVWDLFWFGAVYTSVHFTQWKGREQREAQAFPGKDACPVSLVSDYTISPSSLEVIWTIDTSLIQNAALMVKGESSALRTCIMEKQIALLKIPSWCRHGTSHPVQT